MTILRYRGLEALLLQAPDGATATITLHGGHVVSWILADGEEQLYLSPRSAFATGQAIRGGVPVIFPQFSGRGPLLRHGFARVSLWQVLRQDGGANHALAVLRLTDTPDTRAFWPPAFVLELSVQVGAGELVMTLSCENTGTEAIRFSAALHTYLRTSVIDRTWLDGLGGHRYHDAVDGIAKVQGPGPLHPEGEVDHVYAGVARDLKMHDQGGGQDRHVLIRQRGFEDVVVWNPGPLRCAALTDMASDGWRHMLCVEAARVDRPVELQPGEVWTGVQTLRSLGNHTA